jgi:hypothetical protein
MPKSRKALGPSILGPRPPLGDSSVLNKIVKSATMSALSKRKSPAPDQAPMITITPADEDTAVSGGVDEVAEKGQGEKKKKRKLLGTKAAFKWDPILEVRISSSYVRG